MSGFGAVQSRVSCGEELIGVRVSKPGEEAEACFATENIERLPFCWSDQAPEGNVVQMASLMVNCDLDDKKGSKASRQKMAILALQRMDADAPAEYWIAKKGLASDPSRYNPCVRLET